MFSAWIKGLADRAPARCEVCRSWPARPVCEDCTARFALAVQRCPRCALPLNPEAASGASEATAAVHCGACRREPPAALDACHAAVSYSFPWPDLIARFKFRGEPGWAGTLAALMRAAPGVGPVLEAADHVLPLPLGPRRLAERGYNQALELAMRLAPAKAQGHMLVRTRETLPQSDLDRPQRLHNVRGAFAVTAHGASALQGARVVLVDDVMTSGASLSAAAVALRQAGAAGVTAVVLARTSHS